MKKTNRFPTAVADVFGILGKEGERLRSDLAAGKAEVESNNIIPVDGLLAYLQEKDGELTIALKVVIHISNIRTYRLNPAARVLLNLRQFNSHLLIEDIHRYHLVMCSTLKDMFAHKRKHRFHLSHRYDGRFDYMFVNSDKHIKHENQKLYICRNCLEEISKITNEKFDYREFTPDDFFNHPSAPKVLGIEEDGFSAADIQTHAPAYSKNWAKIAKFAKQRQNYICEGKDCGIQLTGKQARYLHCHHENANIEDNLLYNLKCLCIKCHAEQHRHGHMKTSPDYKEYMKLPENGKL